jgi:hypothetical protein
VEEKKAVSLVDLRLKLEQLKVLDRELQVFGAKKHKYQSYPVSSEELERLEGELGVRLPEDYRHFLLVIGYGAGPYYGLASPDEILTEISANNDMCKGRFPVPGQPFPFTNEQAEECWRIMGEHREAAYLTEFPTDGCIPICFEGCTFWTYLVTAGDLKGSLWSHNEEVYYENEEGPYMDVWNLAPEPPCILRLHMDRNNFKPFVPVWEPALSPFPTFLDWYCAWIDRCFLDLEELKQDQSDGSSIGAVESVAGSGQSVTSKNEFRIFKSIVNLFRFKGKSG